MSTALRLLALSVCFVSAAPLSAGFPASEVFLPDVGRLPGANQSLFYTTVWVTNLGSSTVNFTFDLLLAGQANGSPTSFADTLAAGETRVYDDVIGNTFHLASANGGARIVATGGELFVSERIYNQPSGTPLSESAGQFFSGIPKDFSIGSGESASLQGVYLGSGLDFRYNFILLETSGHSCTVHVQALDETGTELGAKDVPLKPYEQLLLPAGLLASSASSTNARISATVTAGTGTVILAGSQVGNGGPQDQSGFEMSFKDSLLTTGNSGSGVTSLNGLAGAVTLIPGNNITLTTEGNGIKIDGAAGGLSLPFAGSTSTSTPAFQVTNSMGTAIHVVKSGPAQFPPSFGFSSASAALLAETSGGNAIVAGASGTASVPSTALAIATNNAYGVYVISEATVPDPAILALCMGEASGIGASVENGTALGGTSKGTNPTVDVENDGTGDGIDVTTTGGIGINVLDTGGGVGVKIDTTSGASRSVDAKTSDQNDAAIFGSNDGGGGGGAGWGVQGEFQDSNQHPVTDGYLGGATYGVLGEGGSVGDGVIGYGHSGSTAGVYGKADNTGGFGPGVEGENTAHGYKGYLGGVDYGVFAVGEVAATGMKPFVEPHPTDPSKEIRYVCLEGPEAGTYFRGSGHIVNGFATIVVPDHFRMVSSEDGLTVVATPVGAPSSLWIVHQGLDRIIVQGSSDVAFNYMVNGIRKAFPDFQPISENRDFVPHSAKDTMSVRALPAESVRRLKATGILNDDGSINMATVRKLGWDKQPGWRNEEGR